MIKKSIFTILLIYSLLALAACEGGTDGNTAPVAYAGPDQNVTTGSVVYLNGGGSSDADGDLLTYNWSFTANPGSAALSNPAAANPSFKPNVDGVYVIQLIVNDGTVDSAADTVTITASTSNSAPVANAGPDQNVTTGSVVRLDGSGSSDADGDTLNYAWSFVSVPEGSTLTSGNIAGATTSNPIFAPDVDGPYVVQLIVNDGTVDSAADTVTITASPPNVAPVADAGPDRNATTRAPVTLDGSGSSDANLDPLSYSWSFVSVPGGSGITDAELSDATVVNPTFTPDVDGRYVVQLIVNDGTVDSAADTVTIIAEIIARSWGTAERIDAGVYDANSPQVAADAGGNAIAVWHQYDGANRSIYARRYEAGTGWGTAVEIDAASESAHYPQVAFDASGNAIAVWRQWSGNIYARRYEAGTGWGTAEIIGLGDFVIYSPPQVAVYANGNAIAVWEQYDGPYLSIYANRYEAGTGWGTAELIEAGVYDADSPQVAVDASGNAIAVWRQYDGTYNSIYANRYDAGTGWGTVELIEAGVYDADSPQVAVDANGNAIAVWEQYDGPYLSIYANRYEAGTGWGTAELIEAGVYDADSPQVAFDAGGNAIAVWEQEGAGTNRSIYANRYEAGTGWGAAEIIDAGVYWAFYPPQVAFDANGNAIAVWGEHDGACESIYANRYYSGTGWGTAELIETGVYIAYEPQVAVGASGNAIAVWWQYDSDSPYESIYANRYE